MKFLSACCVLYIVSYSDFLYIIIIYLLNINVQSLYSTVQSFTVCEQLV